MRFYIISALLSCMSCGGGRCSGDSKPGAVVIVVDALRADYLGVYGDERPISPNIDAFAKNATVFERFYSASSWTAPAFGTLFTGVSPEVHRAGKKPDKASRSQKQVYGRQLEPMRDDVRTIAETLDGVTSHAIINNSFLAKALGYHRGFGSYDIYHAKNNNVRPAAAVTDLAIDWLKGHDDEAFFLVVHYFDPHLEYNPPPKFRRRFSKPRVGRVGAKFNNIGGIKNGRFTPTDAEKQQIKALYSDEIAYVDQEVGRLLRYLDGTGKGDEAWVAFTADHGEELFDHGDFEHGHRFEDEVTRIPLIIRAPERLRARYGRRRVPQSVRQVDLHPTILSWFGRKPEKRVEGKSVTPLMAQAGSNRHAFMQYVFRGRDAEAIFDGTHKYIEHLEGKDSLLYNLKRDPEERAPIDDARQKKAMQAKLEKYKTTLRTVFKSGRDHRAVTLSPEVDEALKNLGYIEE